MPDRVEQWARWQRGRPRLGELLGDDPPIIGHADLRIELLSRLEQPDTVVLFLISGGKGSGKSSIVRWLAKTAPDRVVIVHDAEPLGQLTLDPQGEDLVRLIESVRPRVEGAGRNAVLVYDEAHSDLYPSGIRLFVTQAIEQLDLGFLVILTATPLTPDFSPIPTRNISLDKRQVDFGEFDQLLQRTLQAAQTSPDAFSDPLRHSLHELCQQTSDFTAVQYIIEMLLAGYRETGSTMRTDHLYRLLVEVGSDEHVRALPAVRRSDDRWMSFRRKDKTELLAELLMRIYPDKSDLAAAAESLEDFDPATILDEATDSYRESVISMCLTRSPLELVGSLLGPRDIRKEVKLLQLDPKQLVGPGEDQAKLLVRGLGFSFAEVPRGLEAYRDAVDNAARLGSDRNARSNVLKGLHDTVVKQVELAMRDLLHFWGSYLFGSVRQVVEDVNRRRRGKPLLMHKLLMGEIVLLLGHLDTASERDDAAFKLSLVDLRRPLSAEFLKAYKEFTDLRNHGQALALSGRLLRTGVVVWMPDDAPASKRRAIGLNQAKCQKAIFNGANLVSARLKGAILRDAEFKQAELQDAHFEGADLTGANFIKSNLNNAYFTGCDLDDKSVRTIVKAVNWSKAHFDENVKAQLASLSTTGRP